MTNECDGCDLKVPFDFLDDEATFLNAIIACAKRCKPGLVAELEDFKRLRGL